MEDRGNVKSDAIKKGPAGSRARDAARDRPDARRPRAPARRRRSPVDGPRPLQLLAARARRGGQGRHPRGRRHPLRVRTIAISDGISMGTDGMRASLVSRESSRIPSSWPSRHALDAVVALCGCDKTIPGAAMALARLDLPSVALYGGSIEAGKVAGKDVTIQDVFEAVARTRPGRSRIRSSATSRPARAPARARAAASTRRTRWRWR